MRLRIIAGTIISFVAIITLIITQFVSNQPLSNEDLKEQLENLDSFTQESSVILDQYHQDRVSFTYVKNQTEQINRSVHDFYQLIQSKDIPDKEQENVLSLEKIVS